MHGVAAEPVKTYVARRRMRDPAFRLRILEIYEGCCAVCGLDLKIGGAPVGMEAAHIKWHQAGGPDQPANGLALCSLHHRLFDRGAFTISVDYEVTVTEEVQGGESLQRWLMDYHRKPLRAPAREENLPATRFIRWHQREVFRPPPRK